MSVKVQWKILLTEQRGNFNNLINTDTVGIRNLDPRSSPESLQSLSSKGLMQRIVYVDLSECSMGAGCAQGIVKWMHVRTP